jgi:hypothetical protein
MWIQKINLILKRLRSRCRKRTMWKVVRIKRVNFLVRKIRVSFWLTKCLQTTLPSTTTKLQTIFGESTLFNLIPLRYMSMNAAFTVHIKLWRQCVLLKVGDHFLVEIDLRVHVRIFVRAASRSERPGKAGRTRGCVMRQTSNSGALFYY